MTDAAPAAERGLRSKPSITRYDFSLQCGKVIGRSDWLAIDQPMVNSFADITFGRQLIHIDPARAAVSVFGGTIVHGILLLSLLSVLYAEAVPPLKCAELGVNFGFDSVRLISPVRTGPRISASFILVRFEEEKPGQWRTVFEVIVETEGSERAALAAEWPILWICQ